MTDLIKEAMQLVQTKLAEIEESYTDSDEQDEDKQLLKKLMQSLHFCNNYNFTI